MEIFQQINYKTHLDTLKEYITTSFKCKMREQLVQNIKEDILTTTTSLFTETVIQNFKATAIITTALVGLDIILNRCVNKPYYLLHSMANWGIVYYTLPTIRQIYKTIHIHSYLIMSAPSNYGFIPDYDLDHIFSRNYTAFQICTALHLYHILRYKMNKEDIKHHIPTLAILSIPLFNLSNSPLIEHTLFYLCGLSGAIDYLLLSLSRNGIINNITEKRWNVLLNLYIRCPGSIVNASLSLYLLNLYKYNIPMSHQFAYLGVAGFSFWNGTYYLRNVTADYHIRNFIINTNANTNPITTTS